MTTETTPILYGVWLPTKGWLRGEQSKALMFEHKAIAKETAQRIGSRAKVYFIDQSLVDIEYQLLEAEKQNSFKAWFQMQVNRLYKFLARK
jgi:hypothetical protein